VVVCDTFYPTYSDTQQSIWNLRVDVQSTDGIPVSTLEPHTALRHLCVHLAKHGFEHGLRWLLDIRLFLEHYEQSIHWSEFMAGCDRKTAPIIAYTLSLAADWLGAKAPADIKTAFPPEIRGTASSLVWYQIWDYERARKPPNVLIAVMSGNPRQVCAYLLTRIVRWTSPIPGRNDRPLVLLGKRLWSDLRIFKAAFREGGFRFSSMRMARRGAQRFTQLRNLFGLPADR